MSKPLDVWDFVKPAKSGELYWQNDPFFFLVSDAIEKLHRRGESISGDMWGMKRDEGGKSYRISAPARLAGILGAGKPDYVVFEEGKYRLGENQSRRDTPRFEAEVCVIVGIDGRVELAVPEEYVGLSETDRANGEKRQGMIAIRTSVGEMSQTVRDVVTRVVTVARGPVFQ